MHGTNDDSVLQSKVMFNNKQTMLCIRSSCVHAKLLQLCPTLCNPIDRCPPGSSIHGILQARILDWVAMPSSRDIPNPEIKPTFLGLLHWQVGPLPLAPPEKPIRSC